MIKMMSFRAKREISLEYPVRFFGLRPQNVINRLRLANTQLSEGFFDLVRNQAVAGAVQVDAVAGVIFFVA